MALTAMEPAVQRTLVIDTDAGIDDAGAILLALAQVQSHRPIPFGMLQILASFQPESSCRILAFTTVHGNAGARPAACNIDRLLRLYQPRRVASPNLTHLLSFRSPLSGDPHLSRRGRAPHPRPGIRQAPGDFLPWRRWIWRCARCSACCQRCACFDAQISSRKSVFNRCGAGGD